MFDPRRVYSNDRRYSYKAQIIQKRPVTSEQNAKRPVHPSDLERAKIVMNTYNYSWYAFNPVMRIELRPKATLQPLYVDPYDTLVKDLNLDYWEINNPEFYRGTYQAVIFLRAYNVYCTTTPNLDVELFYLVEAYYCSFENNPNFPGYGNFSTRGKKESTSQISTWQLACPYTDQTYTTYRLCQSALSDEYTSVIEAIAIAY